MWSAALFFIILMTYIKNILHTFSADTARDEEP